MPTTLSSARIGVALLPEVNPAADDRWRTIERLGFAHAWCFDHLAWRSLADSAWYGTVPVLAAAALTTERIRLGTFVASPNFRHPVPFAKELMTLDVMSAGRLTLAVGAGAPGFDAAMLGGPTLSPGARQRRFEEFVTLLDLVLRQPVTSWSGEFYAAVDARTVPGCVQQPRPPFVVAANGPRGMALAAAAAQGWVTMGTARRGAPPRDWWIGVADAAQRFADLDPARRVSRHLDMMSGPGPATSVEQVRDGVGRAVELGFTDVIIAWPRSGDPYRGSPDVLEGVAAELRDGVLTV